LEAYGLIVAEIRRRRERFLFGKPARRSAPPFRGTVVPLVSRGRVVAPQLRLIVIPTQ